MFDERSARRVGANHDEHARRAAPSAVPGRSTRVQELESDGGPSEPLFAGEAVWEDIEPQEGERMELGLAAAPARDESGERDEEEDGEEGKGAEDAEAPAEDAEAPAVAAKAAASPAAKRGARKKRKVPSSAYATSHGKEMKNYRYKADTRVTNTVSTANGRTSEEEGDFGRPNEYKRSKVPAKYAGKILRTVSVDIGTVVGGKAPRYLDGWVLVFHKSFIERKGKERVKVDTGDHTGWIRVRQLAPKAITALAKRQQELRRELSRGKGSGHKAPVKGGVQTFSIQNADILADESGSRFFEFRIRGGGDSTPLGNYTLRPQRYGNVIIGVWNPPGSGAGGKRFGGSGGIRAFFPLNAKFRLADVGAMEIADTTGRGTSTWRYVRAKLNGEQIYCWLLQSWRTPKGNGSNF